MWKNLLAILVASIAVLLGFVSHKAGVFTTVPSVNANTCVRMDAPGLAGAEDLTVFEGAVFLSADQTRREFTDAKFGRIAYESRGLNASLVNFDDATQRNAAIPRELQGGLYLYREDAGAAARRLEILDWDWKKSPDFHPHGIAMRRTSKGEVLLLVVVHSRLTDAVALLRLELPNDGKAGYRSANLPLLSSVDLSKAVLRTLRVVRDPSFRSLNDLVFSGDGGFYATNFLHTSDKNKLGALGEMLAMRRWGSVVECVLLADSTECVVVSTRVYERVHFIYSLQRRGVRVQSSCIAHPPLSPLPPGDPSPGYAERHRAGCGRPADRCHVARPDPRRLPAHSRRPQQPGPGAGGLG